MRSGGRRGAGLGAVAALAAAAALLAGCGDSGGSATASEREADAEIVNAAVGRELTLIDAFDQGAPLLRSRLSKALIRRFRGQEQEHLNGLTKTIRGLSADLEGEAEELDFSQVKSERDLLLLVYRLTSTNLTAYLEAVPHLATTAPRAISASIAANEAEHLVVLRQALGAAAPASIPEAFDTGEVPPPAAAPSGASARSQTPGSAR